MSEYHYEYYKELNLNGLRNVKITCFNDCYIIIGSKVYHETNGKKKYLLYSYQTDNEFDIIEKSENILNFESIVSDYKENIDISCWVRDVYSKNDKYYLLVEFKKNNDEKYFTSEYYLLETTDFFKYEVTKKYDLGINNLFLFKEYNENFFISIIENTNHIWGKYLFEFVINGIKITPKFDKNVDYEKDYGHALHYLNYDKINNQFNIIFSIRHYSDNEKNNFYYKIYESFSNDLVNYYNTNEIIFKMNETINSKWFCYPVKFTCNNEEYILCNQDDYGKYSKPIILRKNSISKKLLEEKYKINSHVTSKLFFDDNKKYIYLNEIKEKNGKRYNDIINNNESLTNYSTHSPSCVELYNVLKNLNISNSDSIIDIGSGKGWALVLFNLFPFKKITGIELSEEDVNVCKNNLNILNINSVDVIHQDANEYNSYNDYNYFYFYNPFGSEIFENIIKKITSKNVTIIYNNIHECERKILNNNNYKLVNEVVGTFRNYFIYKNC